LQSIDVLSSRASKGRNVSGPSRTDGSPVAGMFQEIMTSAASFYGEARPLKCPDGLFALKARDAGHKVTC